VDDDGSGYVDNGMDDWDGAGGEEESEDEDDFEGEDEELRRGEYGAAWCWMLFAAVDHGV
jgi:DNA polymerase alpha subunit A